MKAFGHIALIVLVGWFFHPACPALAGSDSQPDLGRINGTIAPAARVQSIRCLDRAGRLSFDVHWRGATGRFDVANLALGLRYDLEVTTTDGVTFIGVDLSFEEEQLARLARLARQTDEPNPSPTTAPAEIADEDRAGIERIVTQVEVFENERKILALAGDHARATALVELRRTTPFHSGKAGEQIRRVDLWYFKYQHGGWEKVANAEKVLSRTRGPAGAIEKQIAAQVYLPALGGILVDKTRPIATVTVTLPNSNPTSQPADSATSPHK